MKERLTAQRAIAYDIFKMDIHATFDASLCLGIRYKLSENTTWLVHVGRIGFVCLARATH